VALGGGSDEARAIADADYLLIVAAAGLSISDEMPNNPYHSAADFEHHYPTLASFGYRTCFEAMGLAGDSSVPPGVKLAFTARHFLNMRSNFPPTPGYEALRRVALSFAPDRVFCWTSNVDGCFERSGFDARHIYTSQGDMKRYQCAAPGCGHVWDVQEQLRAIDAAATDGVLTDLSLAPACTRCGAQWPQTRPNLRGGDWFIHRPYEAAAARLPDWLDHIVESRGSVAIIEVGVGPNTPIVTRIPACAFASAVQANGGRAVYLRINPDAPEGARENPARGVAFSRWRQTWRALDPLAAQVAALRAAAAARTAPAPAAEAPAAVSAGESREGPRQDAATWQRRYHQILESLHTRRLS